MRTSFILLFFGGIFITYSLNYLRLGLPILPDWKYNDYSQARSLVFFGAIILICFIFDLFQLIWYRLPGIPLPLEASHIGDRVSGLVWLSRLVAQSSQVQMIHYLNLSSSREYKHVWWELLLVVSLVPFIS